MYGAREQHPDKSNPVEIPVDIKEIGVHFV